jgi:hypothetical protein
MFVGELTLVGRLSRLGLTVAAAATLWASFGARTASASCGDYVMVGGHGGPAQNHSIPGVPTCQGPNCRRQAPLPLLPTKTLLSAPPGDSAFWSHGDFSLPPSSSRRLDERRLLLADGHSPPLLRPPCL